MKCQTSVALHFSVVISQHTVILTYKTFHISNNIFTLIIYFNFIYVTSVQKYLVEIFQFLLNAKVPYSFVPLTLG